MSEVSPEDASGFVQEFLSSTQNIDGLGIFFNNISALLPMFIPGAGAILGIFSGWSTGFGFAAITTMAPALADIEPLSILLYSPYGIMELSAYSIAMSRSFHIVYSLVKRVNPQIFDKTKSDRDWDCCMNIVDCRILRGIHDSVVNKKCSHN